MRPIEASNHTLLNRSHSARANVIYLGFVQLMRAALPQPRTPVLYEPSIVIVGQGRKRGYLGGTHLYLRPA